MSLVNQHVLWSIEEILQAIDGTLHQKGTRPILGVSIDGRTIKHNEVFFAIEGPKHNGHAHLAQAIENGASAVIISMKEALKTITHDIQEISIILVEDTKTALIDLAKSNRLRLKNATFIGITGSVGKTTSKESIRYILSQFDTSFGSYGNFNNDIGLSLSLANMPQNTRFGVFELGISKPDEMVFLSKILQPHYALITTISAAHRGAFQSLDEIAHEKAAIMAGMNNEGTVILNKDNSYYKFLCAEAEQYGIKNIVTFGSRPGCMVELKSYHAQQQGSALSVEIEGKVYKYYLNTPGRHWIILSLGMIATLFAVGVNMEKAISCLAKLESLEGRGKLHHITLNTGISLTLVDDSYNASPASMRAAIDTLSTLTPKHKGRRLMLLGDMLELGGESKEYHVALAKDLHIAEIDHVFLVGEEMAALKDILPEGMVISYQKHVNDILAPLTSFLQNGDVLTIKGSHAIELELAVAHILNQQQQQAS